MSQIHVKCTDQVVKIVKAPVIASGGLNEVSVVFDFCEKWDGFVKTALFYRDTDNIFYAVLDDNDTCVVPWEVCYADGYFFFSVFGEKGSTRRTSNKNRYRVIEGAITEGFMPSEPTPDVYDQIIALVAETKDVAQSFRGDAMAVINEAAGIANTAAEAANAAAGNAQNAAANANEAKNAANEAAMRADNSAEAANKAATAANNAKTAADTATTKAEEATVAANNAAGVAEAVTAETIAARDSFLETAGESMQTIVDLLGTADEGPAIVCEETGSVIIANDASNRLFQGLTLYGKTTQDGTPTPENPVELVSAGNGGAINTTVCGGNLFDMGAAWPNCRIRTDTGVAEGLTGMYSSDYTPVAPETAYVLNFSYYSTGNYGMAFYNKDKVYISGAKQSNTYAGGGDPFVFTTPENCAYIRFSITPDYIDIAQVILNAGTTVIPHEPYTAQSLTAHTPNGLPGIPVTSGGNYTDENGQAWICDEIDFARGVYVQRVTTDNIDNYAYFSFLYRNSQYTNLAYYNLTNRLEGKGLATHFTHNIGATNLTASGFYYGGGALQVCFENPVLEKCGAVSGDDASYRIAFQAWWREQATAGKTPTFMLALKTPIETPLSAEELAQYSALHTNKPNIFAYNDAGAGMKLAYVADTKLYIDKKFNELAAAIVNNA